MWHSSVDTSKDASIQQAPLADTFPFDKLPAELQLMVIRFAMPEDGLRSIFHRNKKYEPPPSEPIRRASIPTGLFRTNHYLSAVSLDTFRREVCMHIGVSPIKVTCFGHRVTTHPFPASIPKSNAHFFTSMRNYQLNIRPAEARPSTIKQKKLKEQLRRVSDMLSENDNIKHLTVTFPCHCSWYCHCSGHCRCALRDTSRVVAAVLDFLSPLKRIKVAKTVVFKPASGLFIDAEDDNCNGNRCLSLAHTMEASMGQLNGEALTYREATWKRIKAIEPPHTSWTPTKFDYYGFLDKFCSKIEEMSDEEFKIWTQWYIERIERLFTQWEIQKAADRVKWIKSLKQCYNEAAVVRATKLARQDEEV
ncbi:MAG: hypothetical protein LQ337_001553 [Flavoplaca oasis]|nr:MAG: hypothetical protein LQ337_001553 [Flavoplaca oasis]